MHPEEGLHLRRRHWNSTRHRFYQARRCSCSSPRFSSPPATTGHRCCQWSSRHLKGLSCTQGAHKPKARQTAPPTLFPRKWFIRIFIKFVTNPAPHSAITHVEYEAASSSRRGYPELGALIYQIIFSKQCEDIKYSLQKPRHEY